MPADDSAAPQAAPAIDPTWTASRTARQLFDLHLVEKTDGPDDKLPQGEERSEQFVIEVSEYFERLNTIQLQIRSGLAHIRHARIPISAINAPPADFIPSSLGVGLPGDLSNPSTKTRGLQEEKVDRDAWNGILEALTQLKEARDAERQQQAQSSEDAMQE
ncbi:hypothetical protein CC1G_00478 [Coprinopsis cinerea okayama7|uniref:Mediator complex subunit 11 n=1 Tax=Coprinopsis cinerea (strain Okayama-7 / 130 / ATCC MYA-4618 / FGSC 9003) TaxID=240176 RepID=A8N354_COPC7|nr:hypothetical protein CC1G_00478 [Coprinopsis cinerea okayama7\|eukprot:XP_001829299.1 hypothetical protein CC1G_00478 [Coprinopsis cinerea okayama7\